MGITRKRLLVTAFKIGMQSKIVIKYRSLFGFIGRENITGLA